MYRSPSLPRNSGKYKPYVVNSSFYRISGFIQAYFFWGINISTYGKKI